MLRSWHNQMVRLVGGRAVLSALCALTCLFALVFGYFATREFVYPMLSSFPGGRSGAAVLMGLIFTNVSVMASVLLGVFLILSPPQTALDNILATRPVRRNERILGYLLPLISVTLLILAVIYAPVFLSFAYGNGFSFFESLWVIFAATTHALYVVLLDLVLYLLVLAFLLRTLAAGYSLSQAVAASSVVVVSLASFLVTFSRADFSAGGFLLHPMNVHVLLIQGPTSGSVISPPAFFPLATLVTVSGTLLVWMLLDRVALLSVPTERPTKRAWLRRLPFGRRSLPVFLSRELKEAARHSENVVFSQLFVFVSLALVAFSAVAGVTLDRYAVGLPLLIWLLCSLFAMNSYGRTLPSLWLLGVLPRRRSAWLAAKVLSNCVFSGLLAALLFLIYATVSEQTSVATFLDTAPYGLLFVLGITLSGTLLPYSEEYPFASAFSALFVTVVGVPLGYAFQKLVLVVPEALLGATVFACAAALVLLIYLVDSWRAGSDDNAV